MASIQHLVDSHAITANQAVATRGKVHKLPDSTRGLTAECVFVDGGAGGTIDVYIQTSMDFSGSTTGGTTSGTTGATSGEGAVAALANREQLPQAVRSQLALGEGSGMNGVVTRDMMLSPQP